MIAVTWSSNENLKRLEKEKKSSSGPRSPALPPFKEGIEHAVDTNSQSRTGHETFITKYTALHEIQRNSEREQH